MVRELYDQEQIPFRIHVVTTALQEIIIHPAYGFVYLIYLQIRLMGCVIMSATC